MKIQHQQLVQTAQKLGIKVTNISMTMGCDAAILEHGNKKELLINGTPTSLINTRSQYYCDNKQLAKSAFDELNIPSPKSKIFRTVKDLNLFSFFEKGKYYVCKPVNGTDGIETAMNIKSFEGIEKYWHLHKDLATYFMLEEQIEGNNLMIQVVGGKIVAACTRIPAFVIGDGQQTILQLAKQLQTTTRANNPANDLVLDETIEKVLEEQHVSFQYVLPRGTRIQLKKFSNMAQGAIAMDLTAELNTGFQKWIDQLVTYLKTSYFSIDVIALDHRQVPENGAWVLKINAKPKWLYHTFADGKKYDIATLVLNDLFFNNATH